MSNLYNLASYKNKVINLLLQNSDFIKLISPESKSKCNDIDIIDVLLGGEWIIGGKNYKEQGYVFDYNFVNDTITQDKTFVFVETDVEYVKDKMFADFNLFICIFTSKDLVRLTECTSPTVKEVKDMGYFAGRHGNRIDVLCDIVDRTINGNKKIPGLGTVSPDYRNFITQYCPTNKYYGKCLKYKITNLVEGGDECEDY